MARDRTTDRCRTSAAGHDSNVSGTMESYPTDCLRHPELGLNRRQMCRLLVSAPAVLACTASALGADRGFGFRYALASCLYGTTPLGEILPELKKTGAEHLDLWPRPHGDQREQIDALGHDQFADLLRSHGLKLGVITRYDLGPLHVQEEMRVLRKLGGSVLVTGSRATKQPPTGEALKQQVRAFVEALKPHTAAAEEQGVTIAIENHANALVCSTDSIRWFAELARSPRLAIALAPYHLPQEPALLASLIEDLGPRLAVFYAWQHGRGCTEKLPKEQELEQLPGRGPLDFAPLVAALKKIDFQGFTEIFMHPVPRGIPILPTTGQVTAEIERARRAFEKPKAESRKRD